VSRLIAPSDFAVVTCGSIHGGESKDVVPDEVRLKLNIRTYETEARKRIIVSMKQIIRSEPEAFGTPQPPDITPTS